MIPSYVCSHLPIKKGLLALHISTAAEKDFFGVLRHNKTTKLVGQATFSQFDLINAFEDKSSGEMLL